MRRQQLAAIVALIVGTATIVFAIANAVSVFPRGLVVLALCWSPAHAPGTACCGAAWRAWRGWASPRWRSSAWWW